MPRAFSCELPVVGMGQAPRSPAWRTVSALQGNGALRALQLAASIILNGRFGAP